MLQLASGSISGQDIYAAPKVVGLSLPASPVVHKIMVRVDLSFQNTALRVLTVKAYSTNAERDYTEFEVEIDTSNKDAGEGAYFPIGPLTITAADGLTVSIRSDNAGDTNESATLSLLSDDRDYFWNYVLKEESPTVGSHAAQADAILADTNELQGDWEDTGRLDSILDSRSSHSAAAVWSVATRNLTSGAIVAATFGAGAIDAAALATDAVNEIRDALLAGDWSGVTIGTVTLVTTTTTVTDAVTLTEAERNAVADALLLRDVDNVEATANEHTLCTTVLAMLESSIAGETWTIRRTGGTTHATKTVTVDADADPITGVS